MPPSCSFFGTNVLVESDLLSRYLLSHSGAILACVRRCVVLWMRMSQMVESRKCQLSLEREAMRNETALSVDFENDDQAEGIPPEIVKFKRGRPFRRSGARKAHMRRNKAFEIADNRAYGLKHKMRGKAPRKIYVPLQRKALKLAKRAS